MNGRSLLLGLWLLLSACSQDPRTSIEFWAMGREGELVKSLVPEFERRNPNLHVKVQQIPWSAAHEKLLTAYAGEAMPDVFQLGNTWIPEFVALGAIEALDALVAASADWDLDDFFPRILDTNRIGERLFGVPWYVDTRVMFYRKDLLARAGYAHPPQTWDDWLAAMERLKSPADQRYAMLLPMNEWQMPVILALQSGAALLRDGERYGNFRSEPFRRAFAFYLGLFRRQLAPAAAEAQIANLYQEFANGYFAIYVTGPWNLGEFHNRLPEALQTQWATAPLPAPDDRYPGVSLAGGASLALSRTSAHKAAAWKLIEYLAEAGQQEAFYRLSGDLPARVSAWRDAGLAADERAQAFRRQLEHVAATPKIPEWERIAGKIAQYAEKAVRGEMTMDAALSALDADVDSILEKRRWLLDRGRH